MMKAMDVQIIVVPYDSGHFRQRMGLGPERIEADLIELFQETETRFAREEILLGAGFSAEISTAFQICRKVAERVRDCRQHNVFPIVLSGNCNAAVGTVSGCDPSDTGVVWFDAHGESTTPETTLSGFLDGMGVSILTGQCWQTLAETVPGFSPVPGKRIVLCGARDVEPAEYALLNRIGVLQVIDFGKMEAIVSAKAKNFNQVYVHVDLDVLDPTVAIANQWATPGGINLETLIGSIEEIRKSSTICALGIASYDPAADLNRNALNAAKAVVHAALCGRRE